MTRACLRAGMVSLSCLLLLLAVPRLVSAEREPVLKQVELPHSYYYREMYLPQLTSGPSAVSWSPDGSKLVYSMQGSLWVQRLGSPEARQVTAGPGYDYQPDWSPDGRSIIFVRYLDDALELYMLEIGSGQVTRLTNEGAVNVDPRWSPDGSRVAWVSTAATGRFRLFVGELRGGVLSGAPLADERVSSVSRYYYSKYDHELSPSWSPDGTELLYVANPENAYGTGGLWRRRLDAGGPPVLVRDEETTWKARPDWSPDGRRVIWSSYHGRQWHQLWITTARGGGDPVPLTYGDFDVTGARWSPDGKRVAYLSNESGSTELWVIEFPGGKRERVVAGDRQFLKPYGTLRLRVVDASGEPLASRVQVTGSDGRDYAPDGAWIHADDQFDRAHSATEDHYFHSTGESLVRLPAGEAQIAAVRGLEYHIARQKVNVSPGESLTVTLTLRALDIPDHWRERWVGGDVHVHMNYGGTYRNTPERLVAQAEAENLPVIFNLVVNKEQRVPDIGYFGSEPDPASTGRVMLQHAQEFHSGYWGHLGLLGLNDHFLMPDYSAYGNTGLASPYPDNATVADLSHEQNALVGYVHPYDRAPVPATDLRLTSALPVDVALGKVDYYEVSGFSDYRETQAVWYRLLNCGFRPVAAGGTDAMANFASLRGPVGLNRAYVMTEPGSNQPEALRDRWLAGLKAGRSMATNGPLLHMELGGEQVGGEIRLPAGDHSLELAGFMRSLVPVDHLEIVVNGEVARVIELDQARQSAAVTGSVRLNRSSWVLLRARNDDASPEILDRFPYATTNPVFVVIDDRPIRSARDADYFIEWIDRVRENVLANPDFNNEAERSAVLASIAEARKIFNDRR